MTEKVFLDVGDQFFMALNYHTSRSDGVPENAFFKNYVTRGDPSGGRSARPQFQICINKF
jgi:hypothetical protein